VLEYLRAKLGARYELVCINTSEKVLNLARGERPDLILCDIDMPGMDGGDVSAALFADDRTRGIPVLFLSALLSAEKEVGGRHAIAKSAPLPELVAKIESLLHP
jgi:putative two-component system response regulator